MFDLTKKIKLTPELQKTYDISRALLHFVFLFVMLFVLYRILFPIIPLNFSLDTPNSSKNTLVSVRVSQTGKLPSKKLMHSNETLLFNANPVGQFSKASITFNLGKNSNNMENTPIKIQRSYQAFFYPQGEPAGFKNGTLVSTPDGGYYIISDGMLRRFSNTDIILELGYPKSAFIDISNDDLKLHKAGLDITDANDYPNDTLFVIDDNFYQLKNNRLFPFVSARAFLSQFDGVYAIAKGKDFLSRYPMSETYLGFADGTLLSSTDSVFVISEGKSYPIENEMTFAAMGFSWDNVIAASADEISANEKQKQFTNNDSHPNGTIFFDQKINKYFVIENGKKLPMESLAVISTYSKQKPIFIDSSGIETEASCILNKKLLNSNTYSCDVSLEKLTSIVGNDYQISTVFPANATLDTINMTFSTPLTFNSLMNSLSTIKNRIQNR